MRSAFTRIVLHISFHDEQFKICKLLDNSDMITGAGDIKFNMNILLIKKNNEKSLGTRAIIYI